MNMPPKTSRSPLRKTLVGGMCLALSLPALSAITGSVVINPDGTFTYFYQVDNQAGLFDISLWSLEFEFATPDWNVLDTFSGGDVSVPNLFWLADAGIPLSGASAQDFLSLDPSGDVLAGTLLGGFSFTSSRAPGSIVYREFSPTGDSASGTTLGPASVIPEAGTWIGAASLGVLVLTGILRRRSRGPTPR